MRIPALLAAASIFAHALFFIGAGFVLADLLVLPRVFAREIEGDWIRVWPYVAETLPGWWPVLALGLASASLAGWLLWTSRFGAAWFRTATRVIGWLWLPLLPVGPVVGAALLWCLSKREPQ